MPTLHRYSDRPGYYARGLSNGQQVLFQLTPEGEQYLTETLGLGDGAKFTGDTLKWLYRKKWAAPGAAPPAAESAPPPAPEAPAPAPPAAEPAVSYESNPVIFHGVVEIRLAAGDHVVLDQSAEEVVRTLVRTQAGVLGPIPLPVQVQPYVVLRDGARKVYEMRLYQRLLQVRQPRRQTVEAMNHFSLPREVDVKVEM